METISNVLETKKSNDNYYELKNDKVITINENTLDIDT